MKWTALTRIHTVDREVRLALKWLSCVHKHDKAIKAADRVMGRVAREARLVREWPRDDNNTDRGAAGVEGQHNNQQVIMRVPGMTDSLTLSSYMSNAE